MKRFTLSLPCLLCVLLVPVLLSSCASSTGMKSLSTNGTTGKFTDSWHTVPLLPMVDARISMPGVPESVQAEKDMMFITLGGGGEMYAVMAVSDRKNKLPVQELEKEMMPMMSQMLSGGALQLKVISQRDIVVDGRKGKELIMARQYSPRMRMVFHTRMVMRNDHEAVFMIAAAFEVPAVKAVIDRFMGSLKFND